MNRTRRRLVTLLLAIRHRALGALTELRQRTQHEHGSNERRDWWLRPTLA